MSAAASKVCDPAEQEGDASSNAIEALLWLPSGYKDYTRFKTSVAKALRAGCEHAVFKLKLQQRRIVHSPRLRMQIAAVDMAGAAVDFAIFEADRFDVWKSLNRFDEVYVEGVPSVWNDQLQIKNAALVTLAQQGRVVATYRGRKGMTGPAIEAGVAAATREDVRAVCVHISSTIGRPAAELVRDAKLRVRTLEQLLLDLHAPKSVDDGKRAIEDARRLMAYQIVAAGAQATVVAPHPDSVIRIDRGALNALATKLQFRMTQDQIKAVKEIVTDLADEHPMRRVLSGDVGTGKTATFAIVAAAARAAGAKVAILVPNQLLVDQIANEMTAWWPETPLARVKAGDVLPSLDANPVLIGTTALLFQLAKRPDWKADLLVVDEQHKQSAKIRETLVREHTNLLEATATPIPRTTALVAYGGMRVSSLTQCPVEKCIHTQIMTQANRRELFQRVAEIVGAGGQVAVIYPRVSDDEQSKASVEQAAAAWERILPGRVGMLHGRMADDEKERVIGSMKERRFDVLVSSTVIEVGVTLPDLKGLVVVNPDRYGVSALHQMRGRVARGGGEGFFYLYCQNDISADTLARLNLLVQHSDGLTLAIKDAEMRGYGDLSAEAEKQAGSTKAVFNGVKLMPQDFAAF